MNDNTILETGHDLSVEENNTNHPMKTGCDMSVKGHDTNLLDPIKVTAANKTMGSGYDLLVKGHNSNMFYPIHSVAISCIVASLICAILVFVFAIRKKTSFFKRLKCERFVVYLSICDGCFNICHLMDHMQYIITKSHPNPVGICSFYAFMMCIFVMAQMLCVNIVAINTFRMTYFGHKPHYGKRDYTLLIYMFGVPLSMAVLFVSFGQFGPNGYFCGFDGVKGGIILLLFTTVPTGIILAVNSVLYILTWSKLHQEAKRLKCTLGKNAVAVRASHNAAKSMSILVGLFFIQWTPSLVFGVWDIVDKSPDVVVLVVVLTSNAGGVLNGIAYALIHKNKGKHRLDRKWLCIAVTNKQRTFSFSKEKQALNQDKDLNISHGDNISNETKKSFFSAFKILNTKKETNQKSYVTNDASIQMLQYGVKKPG